MLLLIQNFIINILKGIHCFRYVLGCWILSQIIHRLDFLTLFLARNNRCYSLFRTSGAVLIRLSILRFRRLNCYFILSIPFMSQRSLHFILMLIAVLILTAVYHQTILFTGCHAGCSRIELQIMSGLWNRFGRLIPTSGTNPGNASCQNAGRRYTIFLVAMAQCRNFCHRALHLCFTHFAVNALHSGLRTGWSFINCCCFLPCMRLFQYYCPGIFLYFLTVDTSQFLHAFCRTGCGFYHHRLPCMLQCRKNADSLCLTSRIFTGEYDQPLFRTGWCCRNLSNSENMAECRKLLIASFLNGFAVLTDKLCISLICASRFFTLLLIVMRFFLNDFRLSCFTTSRTLLYLSAFFVTGRLFLNGPFYTRHVMSRCRNHFLLGNRCTITDLAVFIGTAALPQSVFRTGCFLRNRPVSKLVTRHRDHGTASFFFCLTVLTNQCTDAIRHFGRGYKRLLLPHMTHCRNHFCLGLAANCTASHLTAVNRAGRFLCRIPRTIVMPRCRNYFIICNILANLTDLPCIASLCAGRCYAV